LSEYLVVAGVTRPSLTLLELARARGLRPIALFDPRNGTMVDDATLARAEELCDLVITGRHDTDSYYERIMTATGDGVVVAVCTTFHLLAERAAELARRLGLPGPAPERMHAALDKATVREVTTRAGLPNPRVATLRAGDHVPGTPIGLEFPVVVKPVDGYGKFGTAMAWSQADVDDHVAAFLHDREGWQAEGGMPSMIADRLLVEEFVRGVLFSVECYANDDRATALVAVRRKTNVDNPVLELGSTIPGSDDAHDTGRLHAYAEAVLDALELRRGVFHVEMILSAEGPVLVEVNPRISGGAIPDLVRMATGIDLWQILLDVGLGDEPKVRPASGQPMSHTFLAARETFVAPATLDDDWFDQLTADRVAGECSARPGRPVPAMAGNTTTFGIVRFGAGTVCEAEDRCDTAVAAIGSALGARLWAPSR
jgi:predicted ATP-grasp superfamily ATP-dependent carboligase